MKEISVYSTLHTSISQLTVPFVDFFLYLMKMNCFCDTVDRRKAFCLISSHGYRHISSTSLISDTLRAGSEPAQNLSSGFVE